MPVWFLQSQTNSCSSTYTLVNWTTIGRMVWALARKIHSITYLWRPIDYSTKLHYNCTCKCIYFASPVPVVNKLVKWSVRMILFVIPLWCSAAAAAATASKCARSSLEASWALRAPDRASSPEPPPRASPGWGRPEGWGAIGSPWAACWERCWACSCC